jgi:hypothetical protein
MFQAARADFLGTDSEERFLSDKCIFLKNPSAGHLRKRQKVKQFTSSGCKKNLIMMR